jgi:septal ring factor EnvC (AmiA/AmiB activator)
LAIARETAQQASDRAQAADSELEASNVTLGRMGKELEECRAMVATLQAESAHLREQLANSRGGLLTFFFFFFFAVKSIIILDIIY